MKTTTDNITIAATAPEPYVGMEAVAAFLDLSLATLRKWRDRGDMPFPAYAIGRRIKFRLSEVEAWAMRQAHQNAPQARLMASQ